MKKNRLKFYSMASALLFALFFSFSCSNDDSISYDDEMQLDKTNFNYVTLVTSSGAVDGVVDTDTRTITFEGVTDLSEITEIDHEMANGVTITPDPGSVEVWEENLSFTLYLGSASASYTVLFPDYVATSLTEPVINSLTINTESGDYTAYIDNTNCEITVSGITDLTTISGVDYTLADGVTVSPTFESITGVWPSSIVFDFTLDGVTTSYTMLFPDEDVLTYTSSSSNVLKLSLDESSRQQPILFIGTDIERSQGFIPTAPNFDEVIKWGFGDVDFDVCRVSYDKKQELTEGEPNFSFYNDAVLTMKAIKAAKPDVEFWATMKSDYNGYNDTNNLPDWIASYPSTSDFEPQKYARFLTDYLEYMEMQGLRIKYFSTAKEYTSYVTYSRAVKVIRYMNEYIAERGITQPLYIDACAWSTEQGYYYVKNIVASGTEGCYYGFSCHNYNDDDNEYQYERMVNKVNEITSLNSVGEPFYSFADETSGGTSATSGEEPTSISSLIKCFRNRCELFADGMNGELIFELYSRGYDSETRSIYIPSSGKKDGWRMSNYYAFKTHGNWLEDDMYYYTTTNQNFASNMYTMSFASDNRVYMCILNYNSGTAISDFMIDLGDDNYNGTVRYHVLDQETVKTLGQVSGIEGTTKLYKGKLAFELPAYSLVFFSIDL